MSSRSVGSNPGDADLSGLAASASDVWLLWKSKRKRSFRTRTTKDAQLPRVMRAKQELVVAHYEPGLLTISRGLPGLPARSSRL